MPESRGGSWVLAPAPGRSAPEGLWISRWVEAVRRHVRHPFLASTLLFGLLPTAIVVAYAGFRWPYVDDGFLFSLGAVVVVLVVAPYLVWYYSIQLLPTFFERISGVVADEERLKTIEETHQQLLSDRWWLASILAASPVPILVVGSPAFLRSRGLFGLTDPLLWFVLGVLVWIGALVGIGFLLVLVTISIARTLANEELQVDPLHSDGLGGMSPVGYLAIRTTIMFSLGSLLLPLLLQYAAASGPRMTAMVYTMGILYAAFVALSFLYPTVAVSRRAAELRATILDNLRRQYVDVKRQAGEPAVGARTETTDPEVEQKLQRIRREHADYRRLDVYPMNISILVRLTGSVLLPLSFVLLDSYLRPEIIDRLLAMPF